VAVAGAASRPTSAAAAAAPPTPVVLKVSYSARIGANLPVWMGPESGIAQRHGLDVQLEYIASSSGIPAILSGQVQMANVGGSETLSAAAQGADLVIIGTTLPVYPFVFMAPGHISSVDELKGKTIGVSNIGSTSDTATRVTLRNVGLDPNKDVTIVSVGSLENRMAALFQGAIDGGVAQPPEQLVLEDKGFHVIYDLAAHKVPAAGGGIVVQRSWLKANRDVAQRYIDSLVEAAARSRQDKEAAIKVLQKYLNTDDRRALEATYDFFVASVIPVYPTVNAAQFGDTVAQLEATNPRVKDFDLSTLLDDSLVQSAIERKVGGS
jgi:NitT/TauT family transport system substrate-binding protein